MAHLSEIAVALEKAITNVNEKKLFVEGVRKSIADAEAAYQAAVADVQDLHAKYTAFMNSVMSDQGLKSIVYGQVHK